MNNRLAISQCSRLQILRARDIHRDNKTDQSMAVPAKVDKNFLKLLHLLDVLVRVLRFQTDVAASNDRTTKY